jgi:hypothetical protein
MPVSQPFRCCSSYSLEDLVPPTRDLAAGQSPLRHQMATRDRVAATYPGPGVEGERRLGRSRTFPRINFNYGTVEAGLELWNAISESHKAEGSI